MTELVFFVKTHDFYDLSGDKDRNASWQEIDIEDLLDETVAPPFSPSNVVKVLESGATWYTKTHAYKMEKNGLPIIEKELTTDSSIILQGVKGEFSS